MCSKHSEMWICIRYKFCNISLIRVFPRRLTSGGIFNNRPLLTNDRLLLSLLFSGNVCDGGGQSGDRGILPVPPQGKTLLVRHAILTFNTIISGLFGLCSTAFSQKMRRDYLLNWSESLVYILFQAFAIGQLKIYVTPLSCCVLVFSFLLMRGIKS